MSFDSDTRPISLRHPTDVTILNFYINTLKWKLIGNKYGSKWSVAFSQMLHFHSNQITATEKTYI